MEVDWRPEQESRCEIQLESDPQVWGMMSPVEFFASVYRVSSYLCKAEAMPCMRTGRDREDLSTPSYELLKLLLGSSLKVV